MESLKDLFIKKKKVPIPQQQKQGDISNIYEKTSIWNNNSILQKSQNLESNNYIEHFEKLLSNLNQSGPDFLEFIQNDIYIMSSNPGRVKEHITVNFSSKNNLKESKEYLDLVSYIDNII